jgi:hypothetical protein
MWGLFLVAWTGAHPAKLAALVIIVGKMGTKQPIFWFF